jgi:5-methylcytosine-specific restriction enzyme subunit McrC
MGTIYQAHEREVTAIPISEIFQNGYFEIFPEAQNQKYFDLRLTGTQLNITAGKYIGLIPLNDRVVIEVIPKTPIPNLIHILSRANGDIRELTILEKEYRASPQIPRSILEAMAHALVRSLQVLESQGILKQYEEVQGAGSFFKGRIQFDDSVSSYWSRGVKHRARSRFYDLHANTPENRLLRLACFDLLRNIVATRKTGELLTALYHFEELFAVLGVALDHSAATTKPTSTTRQYENAQRIAAAVLSKKGIHMPGSGEDVKLPSFLVDMETVFEQYVRIALKKGLPTLRVLDGNSEGAKPLFDNKGEPPANPDVVILTEQDPVLVCDVKYKPKFNRADLNQVLTYALSYDVNLVVLFLPVFDANATRLSSVGEIGTIKIYSYSFNLAAPDLAAEEHIMCFDISELVQSIL